MKEVKFGEYIRKLRTAKDISLRGFAKMIEVSPTYISKMELGDFKPPSEEKIKAMAKVLDIDTDELLSLAGKVDLELIEVIKQSPDIVPQFLRTVSSKDMKEFMEKRKKEE